MIRVKHYGILYLDERQKSVGNVVIAAETDTDAVLLAHARKPSAAAVSYELFLCRTERVASGRFDGEIPTFRNVLDGLQRDDAMLLSDMPGESSNGNGKVKVSPFRGAAVAK